MAWIKVESSVSRNRKFMKAGPAASWLWLCGLAYCQEGLTDGFIPPEAIEYLGVPKAGRLAAVLVLAGLWDACNEGGWRVHHYLEYNRSAADVGRIKHERQLAGAHGGKVSGEARQQHAAKQPSKQTLESVEANTKQPSNPSSVQLSTATATTTAHPQPISTRRRLHAAWEGAKGLYVPQHKHSDFIGLRNHPGAERELLAWYGQVAEAWTGSPGADMLKFWTARFEEQWPAAVTPAARDTRPEWVKKARPLNAS